MGRLNTLSTYRDCDAVEPYKNTPHLAFMNVKTSVVMHTR
jgi:hypothetical protein